MFVGMWPAYSAWNLFWSSKIWERDEDLTVGAPTWPAFDITWLTDLLLTQELYSHWTSPLVLATVSGLFRVWRQSHLLTRLSCLVAMIILHHLYFMVAQIQFPVICNNCFPPKNLSAFPNMRKPLHLHFSLGLPPFHIILVVPIFFQIYRIFCSHVRIAWNTFYSATYFTCAKYITYSIIKIIIIIIVNVICITIL